MDVFLGEKRAFGKTFARIVLLNKLFVMQAAATAQRQSKRVNE